MKIGVRLFVSSMIFAIGIASLYGYFTRDIIGVIFLGMMSFAMIVCATYIVVAEREANLAGDKEEMEPKDVIGEEIGSFTLESYWPIVAALGTVLVVFGAAYAPGFSYGILIVGLLVVGWTLRFLVREST
jgi:hypothetical protein